MRKNGLVPTITGVALLGLGILWPGPTWAQTPESQTTEHSAQALVDRYCVACHNDRSLRAGLSLENVSIDDVAGHPEVWERLPGLLRLARMGSPKSATRVGT